MEDSEESPSDQMDTEEDSIMHTCDQCGRNFSTFNGLQIHRGKSHKYNTQTHQEHQHHHQNQSQQSHQSNRELRNGGEGASTSGNVHTAALPAVLDATSSQTQQPTSSVEWGDMKGLLEIKLNVEAVQEKITKWQKNFFELPRNSVGKDLIKELTRLFQLYNNKTVWEPIALHLITIFLPIMLQKPSARSKKCDHTRYLKKRLNLWKNGDLKHLLSECEEIQKRMHRSKREEEAIIRGFTRLMMEGNVKKAMKLIDEDSQITGVHTMSEDVKQTLQAKHPKGKEASPEALLPGEAPRAEPVIFEVIDGAAIQLAAKNTSGSGGPSKIDSEVWRHMLCSKAFGALSVELADAVALLARRICTEDVPYDHVRFLFACRLVPLIKENDGVRPVGIGETLRRIIGKSVSKALRNDIQMAGGCLQTCTGVESGIEAAIHAIAKTYKEADCEAVILVDADNAFNRLNRETALHNIERSCPGLYRFLKNSYKEPAKLYLPDGTFILSEEGVTQGDNLAMAMYAVSTRPLIDHLADRRVIQTWFADDSSAAGKLEHLKLWWERLKADGPKYGYFPKPIKTHLIVKSPEQLEKARELFGVDGVNITTEGQRHIGAALGSENFRKEYVKSKVDCWIKDIKNLSKIAQEEPQAALSAFNIGLSQRWTFLQRTVEGISEMFQPVEDAIREFLIPAICGRQVSDFERRMLSLPYRYGGLGIRNPVKTADREYAMSSGVTEELTRLICQQVTDMTQLDKNKMKERKEELKKEKEAEIRNEYEQVYQIVDDKTKKLLLCAQEKGASSWLSSLPIKKLGYSLNKREFRDAIHLRYGWLIPDIPEFCSCGSENSMNHILTCKKGGYVAMRHNALRNLEGNLMQSVCRDVKIEPSLITTQNVNGGNTAEGARLDISAVGLWSPYERTFFDIRVTHPTADSHMMKSLKTLYREHENQKKRSYNDRIINVERATFTPLVFTTTGGMGPECYRMNKRLAELISEKKGEKYSDVMQYIRTRLRFALLRCTLVAIRGVRSKKMSPESQIDDISFNLIPEVNIDD